MSRFPWSKGYKPKPLDPRLYSDVQRFAAEGNEIPRDHPAWKQDARTERDALARHEADLAKAQAADLPDELAYEVADGEYVEDVATEVIGMCRCGTRWAGERVCHCAACHLTFTSVGPFDEHQTLTATGVKCRTEGELRERGLEPNMRGHWRKPRPEETIPGHSQENDR